MASVAAAASHSGGVQVGFSLVAAAGVAAARHSSSSSRASPSSKFVRRWKVGRWLQEHTACPRSASQAWFLISVSWALRGVAVFVLLNALSVGASFPLALAFLCASAASAALPIAPAGAATQAGAGAAILIIGGIPKGEAFAFAVAAQGLVIIVGAALVAAAGIWAAGRSVSARARRPTLALPVLTSVRPLFLGSRASMGRRRREDTRLPCSSRSLTLALATGADAAIITSQDEQGRPITFDVRAATVDTEWYASVLRASAHGNEISDVTIQHRSRAADRQASVAARRCRLLHGPAEQQPDNHRPGREEHGSLETTLLHEYGHHLDTILARPGRARAERHAGLVDARAAWRRLLSQRRVAFDYSLGWNHSIGEVFAEDYAYIHMGAPLRDPVAGSAGRTH